jgi:hypothetical protein
MINWEHPGKLTQEQKEKFLATKTGEEFTAVLKEFFKEGRAKYSDLGKEVVDHMHELNRDFYRE